MTYMIEFSYANEYKSIFRARLHDHYLILNTCIREGVIVLFCLLTKLTFGNDKWNLQGQVKSGSSNIFFQLRNDTVLYFSPSPTDLSL